MHRYDPEVAASANQVFTALLLSAAGFRYSTWLDMTHKTALLGKAAECVMKVRWREWQERPASVVAHR